MREYVQRLDRGGRSGWILPYTPVHIDPSPPRELELAGLCMVIRFSGRRRGGFISTRQSSPIWTICVTAIAKRHNDSPKAAAGRNAVNRPTVRIENA
jgi:hypothetical protein